MATTVHWEFIIVPDDTSQNSWYHGYRRNEEAAKRQYKNLKHFFRSKAKVEVYKVVSVAARHPVDFDQQT